MGVFVFVGLFYISLYINYRTFVWIENPESGLVSKDAPPPKPKGKEGHVHVASRASSTIMPPDEGDEAGQTVELQELQEVQEVQEEPEDAEQEEPKEAAEEELENTVQEEPENAAEEAS